MLDFYMKQVKALHLNQLQQDWRVIIVIITSTVILSWDHYRKVFENIRLELLFFYLVLPLLVILVILRESPAQYGFRLGDWKAGLALTAAAILGITIVIPFVSHLQAFRDYYAPTIPQRILPLVSNTLIELVGWEFFFRGFLLFALYRVAGPHAIWLQAVPFTLAHFGKPELETLSCIFGGAAFGYVAWRTNSFLYPLLIHTYLAVMIVLLV